MSSQPLSMWTSRWLAKPENAFMCAVDVSFFRDRFNLIGLDEIVDNYSAAVSTVLDGEDSAGPGASGLDRTAAAAAAAASAQLLYGLVHARFVMTPRGIAKMLEKYTAGCFGHCPRVNCARPPVLPVGLSDVVAQHTVKLYCPRCLDVYEPVAGTKAATVDGAYFGTGFPHMVFMTRPEYRPPRAKGQHEARIYGFRVHKSARELQRKYVIEYSRGSLPVTNETNTSSMLRG